jgi:hypothetical protein
MPDWICSDCGIASKDHGHKCGKRISATLKTEVVPTPTERTALITLCYMLRDAARKARDTGHAKDDEEFDRLLGLLNLPGDKLLDAVLREVHI